MQHDLHRLLGLHRAERRRVQMNGDTVQDTNAAW